jgi:hypothetical protein
MPTVFDEIPQDDQHYALRYDDPSLAGAAPTAVGANPLAVIGFLSFSTAPQPNRMKAVGAPSFETAFGYTSLT